MTSAKEFLDEGRLAAAIERLTQDVKARPADVASRIFLFELLCFAGDLDRAEKQLDVVAHQSLDMEAGTSIYRHALAAERMRRKVFDEGALPAFLTAPPEHAALHLEALSLQRENEPGKARALLSKSLEVQPSVSGQVDGRPFEEFEDSDLFIGPFLELFVRDRYVWLPFEEIRSIQVGKPRHLRDLIWTQAKLEGIAGDIGEVLLPVLYPGTSSHSNDSIKLGRMTDWVDIGEGLARGVGQRLFMIDGEERAMLQLNAINFNVTGRQ
ncbi:MAG: avirulence locus temperature-dependent protein secretion protein [Acidobacteria bacterium]|nr:MAG: avirulence locus temperature-dependent protein secretion protein [Acidobacteriota bacterium]PYV39446.1 MAG: avirulence locus temperature-dependent protein secretion protein [Acidobacteriota bacterium]